MPVANTLAYFVLVPMTHQNFTTFAAHFMKKHLILKCRQVEKGKTVKSERFKGSTLKMRIFTVRFSCKSLTGLAIADVRS